MNGTPLVPGEASETGQQQPRPSSKQSAGVERKDARLQEADAIYGNLATAEEYGYVTRG